MSKDDNQQPVRFTQKQYDYLNKMFCERTSDKMTNDELRFYSGQRNLVMFIGTKVDKGTSR